MPWSCTSSRASRALARLFRRSPSSFGLSVILILSPILILIADQSRVIPFHSTHSSSSRTFSVFVTFTICSAVHVHSHFTFLVIAPREIQLMYFVWFRQERVKKLYLRCMICVQQLLTIPMVYVLPTTRILLRLPIHLRQRASVLVHRQTALAVHCQASCHP